MAFCRLILPLLVLSVVSASNVPVFLWGLPKTSLKSNPLTTVASPDFEAILRKEVENAPFIVVFTEESLSVEDISRKNADGETSFPFLHSEVPSSLYLPSVENALRVLKDFAEKSDSVDLTEQGLSGDIEDYNNRVLFVNLKDAKEGESRSAMLRRHDELIAEIFDKLEKKYDNVIGVYTGRNPSWTIPATHSRVRRQASEAAVSSPDYIMNGLRLYAKEIKVSTENSTSNITGFLNSSSVFNETFMSTTMDFGVTTLILNFRSAGGYWFFG